MARPRSPGSVNVLVRIDSVVGKMNAPPTPISPRATMSPPGDVACDAISEQIPNHTRPKLNAPFRPKRSPSEPAVSSRHAKTMVYASTIH